MRAELAGVCREPVGVGVGVGDWLPISEVSSAGFSISVSLDCPGAITASLRNGRSFFMSSLDESSMRKSHSSRRLTVPPMVRVGPRERLMA